MAEGRSVTSNDEMHWSVVRGEGEGEQAGAEQEPSRDCRLQSIPAALRDSDPEKKESVPFSAGQGRQALCFPAN